MLKQSTMSKTNQCQFKFPFLLIDIVSFSLISTVKILCSKHNEHLEILKIDGAQLTDQALDYISRCSRLKSILIEFCNNLTGRNFSIFQVCLQFKRFVMECFVDFL